MNYCAIHESCHFISLHSIIVYFLSLQSNIVYSIVFLFYHICLLCRALYCNKSKNEWCQFLFTQFNKSDRKYHYSIDFLFAVYHFIFVKQQISCCFVVLSCFEVVFFIICQINRFGSWRSISKKKNTYVLPFHRFMVYDLGLQRNKVYSIALVFYRILSNVLSSQNFKSIVRAKIWYDMAISIKKYFMFCLHCNLYFKENTHIDL